MERQLMSFKEQVKFISEANQQENDCSLVETNGRPTSSKLLDTTHVKINDSYLELSGNGVLHCIDDEYMIEFTSLEHLKMYDRVSKRRGRICFGTFNEMDEPFLGFSDDNSQSEIYLRNFERMRRSLNPIVVLKRLPKKYFLGGRVTKRIGDDVKSQRNKLRNVSRTPENEIEAVEEVECQPPSFGKMQKDKEDLREGNERVFTVDGDSVSNFPLDRDVERGNSVHAQHTTEGKIQHEEEVAREGRAKRSRRTGTRMEHQPINVDSSQVCHESPRRSLCQIESTKSFKDDGETVHQRIPFEGIIPLEETDREKYPALEGTNHSVKPNSQLESMVDTKRPRSCAICCANDTSDSQLNDDSSHFPVAGFKECSCHGEVESNITLTDVNDSSQKVQDGEIMEENISFIAGRCKESGIRQNPVKRRDESAEEVDSQLLSLDMLQKTEKGSKPSAWHGDVKCNGFFSGVSNVLRQVPDEGIVNVDLNVQAQLSTKSEVSPEANVGKAETPGRGDQAAMGIESQLINVDNFQNSKDLDVGNSVGSVPNKVIVAKNNNAEAHSTECFLPENNAETIVDTASLERNQEIQKGIEEAVQVHYSLRKVEMQLGLVSKCKSGVESDFVKIDNSPKCVKTSRGDSESILDDADMEKEEMIQTQPSINHKIPVELNVQEQGSNQPQCSEESEVHRDTEQFAVFTQPENILMGSTWKSIDQKEQKDGKFGREPCSSEEALVQAPPKRMWALLKPCVVRLERVHDIEKMVRRAAHDDTINYPVIVKGGQRIIGLHSGRRSFPVQHSIINVRLPRKRHGKTSLVDGMDHLAKIDLSDGMALKKFCELNTVSLIDSDPRELNVLKDSASTPILSENGASTPDHSKVDSQLPKPMQSLKGLDPSVDSVVSENPVPSGVQALNELGFLEHESFQFEKEHPSESIWSDVLDFGDADESRMEDSAAPRGKYCDLLPLPFEDHISGMNSEKEIDTGSVSDKVNTPNELDKKCLETMNVSSKMEEDLIERVDQLCQDILDSNLLGKEYSKNDPLISNEDVQKPHFKSSKHTLAEDVHFLGNVKSPGEMSSNVSRKRRSNVKNGKERNHESHRKVCEGLDSSSSDKGCVLKNPLRSNEDVKIKKLTPVENVRECEFLTSLITPGRFMKVSHVRGDNEKIRKERQHKQGNSYSRGLSDNGTARDETNEKIEKGRKRRFRNDLCEMETSELIIKGRKRRFFNDSCEVETSELIKKVRKNRFCSDSLEMETSKNIEKERKRRYLDDLCEIGAEDVSFPVPKIKSVKSLSKKRMDLEYGREYAYNFSLEAERAERELEHNLKKSWLTKSFKVQKEKANDGSVDDGVKSEEIKEEVPTSETLYRDLSTIPYILKCNLQNRCRKCKNLNPCANANKKFKLYFTLTVGVGRRLSKPLLDTFQDEGDESKISRTAAHIAASAVVSRPTTILVPALPEVVQKILPTYHSNLLMQLVAETEKIEKMEKKTISDMAIAETLQLKRALIAMKARYLESRTMPGSQPSPGSESLILQSVQPGSQFMYKTNQIIAMKSKVDNKFRFVRKCLVSVVPKEGQSSEDDTEKSGVIQKQLIDSENQSSPNSCSVPSICEDEYRNESMKPLLEQLLLDPSCDGKNLAMDLKSSNVPGEAQAPLAGPQTPLVCVSLNKLLSRKPLNGLVTGNSDDVVSNGSHHNSSSSSGISSMDSEELVYISENETNLSQAETRNVIIPVNHMAEAPTCDEELDKANEFSPSNELKDMDPSVEVCRQVAPGIEWPESELAKLLSTNSTQGNAKPSTLQDSVQISNNIPDQINSPVASEEMPDVMLIPDECESIDLTTCEEETVEFPDGYIPKWAVICNSLPELGFIKVLKTGEKLIIYDKAVVSEPLEISNIAELNKFLNTRLANLTYSYQSRIALEWILVTSGYLNVKTIPPTNPLFWLPSVTARKTLSDMRNFAKRYGMRQTKTSGSPRIAVSTRFGRSSSLSNAQTTKNDQIKLAVKPKLNVVSTRKGLTKLNIDTAGKIVRINGQTVVMGTPVSFGKTQKEKLNPAGIAGKTSVSYVSSAQVVSSDSSTQVVSSDSSTQVVSSDSSTQVVSSVSSGKPLVGSTPVSTGSTPVSTGAINRFLVVSRPSSVPLTSGLRTAQPGLIYSNSPNGFVPLASKPVQANSPACSAKSSSTVPNQQSSPSPLFLVLPSTTAASSQSTSFRVTHSQPVVNSRVSLGARGLAAPLRQATPINLTPVSSGLRIQTKPTPTSGSRKTTKFCIPLAPSASRNQTPSSLPAQRVVNTTTIRRPFRQIVITPGSVRCTNLSRIAPGSLATSSTVLAASTVQSSQKPNCSTSAAPQQVSPASPTDQVSAATAPKQLSVAPTSKHVSAAPAPNQSSVAPAPNQSSFAPAPNQSSVAPAPHQLSVAPPITKQVSAAPAPNQLSVDSAPKQVSPAPGTKQVSDAPEPNQSPVAPAPKQVAAASATKQVLVDPAPKQVSADPSTKQVSAAPIPKQFSVAPASKQVAAAPATNQVLVAPAPKQVSADPPTKQVSADPPTKQVSAALATKQVAAASAPEQLSAAPVPQRESAAALPSTTASVQPTTVTISPKPKIVSTSAVCASTVLSQKLEEALSQKLGKKVNNQPKPNNRQILILRKGTSGNDQTSNPIKFVLQKPAIPTPFPRP